MTEITPSPFPTQDMRSPMARARGLGSAHDGVHHWIWQRLTAIALVPLSLWFVTRLLHVVASSDPLVASEWLRSPGPTLLLSLMLVALFYHAKLGMQVVIEDYVHGKFWKYTLLILNTLAFFVLGVISLMAVAKLHFHL